MPAVQTVEQEESLLATLLYQNRGVLSCLAARFRMPGQDLLLGNALRDASGPGPPDPYVQIDRSACGRWDKAAFTSWTRETSGRH